MGNKTADWAPGTLDKTRKAIGNIDPQEAAAMAKKLGGEVLNERSSGSYTGKRPSVAPQRTQSSSAKSQSTTVVSAQGGAALRRRKKMN